MEFNIQDGVINLKEIQRMKKKILSKNTQDQYPTKTFQSFSQQSYLKDIKPISKTSSIEIEHCDNQELLTESNITSRDYIQRKEVTNKMKIFSTNFLVQEQKLDLRQALPLKEFVYKTQRIQKNNQRTKMCLSENDFEKKDFTQTTRREKVRNNNRSIIEQPKVRFSFQEWSQVSPPYVSNMRLPDILNYQKIQELNLKQTHFIPSSTAASQNIFTLSSSRRGRGFLADTLMGEHKIEEIKFQSQRKSGFSDSGSFQKTSGFVKKNKDYLKQAMQTQLLWHSYNQSPFQDPFKVRNRSVFGINQIEATDEFKLYTEEPKMENNTTSFLTNIESDYQTNNKKISYEKASMQDQDKSLLLKLVNSKVKQQQMNRPSICINQVSQDKKNEEIKIQQNLIDQFNDDDNFKDVLSIEKDYEVEIKDIIKNECKEIQNDSKIIQENLKKIMSPPIFKPKRTGSQRQIFQIRANKDKSSISILKNPDRVQEMSPKSQINIKTPDQRVEIAKKDFSSALQNQQTPGQPQTPSSDNFTQSTPKKMKSQSKSKKQLVPKQLNSSQILDECLEKIRISQASQLKKDCDKKVKQQLHDHKFDTQKITKQLQRKLSKSLMNVIPDDEIKIQASTVTEEDDISEQGEAKQQIQKLAWQKIQTLSRIEEQWPEKTWHLQSQLQVSLLNFYISNIIQQEYPYYTEQESQECHEKILFHALIDSGLLDLFEDHPEVSDAPSQLNPQIRQLLEETSSEGKELVKKAAEKKVRQYLQYLTSTQTQPDMFEEFKAKLRHFFQKDLIAKHNKKTSDFLESLVNDVKLKLKNLARFVLEYEQNKLMNFLNNKTEDNSFIDGCQLYNAPALPIINKIFNQSLIMQDYALTKQICQALSHTFQSQPRILAALVLDNCNLNEENTNILLEGVTHLNSFSMLILKHSEFGIQAMKPMRKILNKPFPNQLQVLKLINCKIAPDAFSKLMKQIKKNCFLRSLALVKANLNQESIEILSKYLEENSQIRELDISWNDITARQIKPFLLKLSKHNSLNEINLSLNRLVDCVNGTQQINADMPRSVSPVSHMSPKVLKSPRSPKQATQQNQNEIELAEILVDLIGNNDNLSHLILNQCGLTYYILKEIIPVIQTSCSLVSCHLSNNPGLNEQSCQQFAKMLNIQGNNIKGKWQIYNEKEFENVLNQSQSNIDYQSQSVTNEYRNQISNVTDQRQVGFLKVPGKKDQNESFAGIQSIQKSCSLALQEKSTITDKSQSWRTTPSYAETEDRIHDEEINEDLINKLFFGDNSPINDNRTQTLSQELALLVNTQQGQIKQQKNLDKLSLKNLESIFLRKLLREKQILIVDRQCQSHLTEKKFIISRILGFDTQFFVETFNLLPISIQITTPKSMSELKSRASKDSISSQVNKKKGIARVKHNLPSKWNLILDQNKQCWVCDGHIYTLILWNEEIGKKRNLNVHQQKSLISMLRRPTLEKNELYRPLIYCQNTKWIGFPMHTTAEFAFIIDKLKPAELKKIPQNDFRSYEFSGYHHQRQDNFNFELFKYLHKMRNITDFRKTLHQCLDYRDPFFVNFDYESLQSVKTPKVVVFDEDLVQEQEFNKFIDQTIKTTSFVLPAFLKTGQFTYIIEYPKGIFYFHTALIHCRKEPIILKQVASYKKDDDLDDYNLQQNNFIKSNSVFAQMQGDTKVRLDACMKHDIENLGLMKFQEFVDSELIYDINEEIIEQRYHDLKRAHATCLCLSETPRGIDLQAAQTFLLKNCKIKGHTEKSIAELFEQITLYNEETAELASKPHPDKLSNLLCRKEFFELLIMVALRETKDLSLQQELQKEKWIQINSGVKAEKQKGNIKIEKMLLLNIFPASSLSFGIDEISEFRYCQIYTNEIGILFDLYKDPIQKVFRQYASLDKLNFSHLIAIFMTDCKPVIVMDLMVLKRAAIKGKMTVIRDFESEANQTYFYKDFEMFEIICNLAQIQSEGSSVEDMFLVDKVQAVIIQVVQIKKGEGMKEDSD